MLHSEKMLLVMSCVQCSTLGDSVEEEKKENELFMLLTKLQSF